MVSIYQSIKTLGSDPNYKAKTSRLIAFIQRYGVNFIDDHYTLLLDHCLTMSYKQIDIVLSYKPNILYKNSLNEERIVMTGYNMNEKLVYVIKKMIEYDHDFLFVTFKMRFISDKDDSKYEFFTFLEFYKDEFIRKRHKWNNLESYLNQLIDLLENHLKHYQSLFMIMLPEIE